MFLDPQDPAGQAFVADYLNDYPMADWDEACAQSDAVQCDECKGWFTNRDDLDDDYCWDCSATLGPPVNAQREWGTWR